MYFFISDICTAWTRYQRLLQRRHVIRTGVATYLFNRIDSITIKRHLRINLEQLTALSGHFEHLGLRSDDYIFTYKINPVVYGE